jgi:hypothetical protein
MSSNKVKDLWLEFLVQVPMPHLGGIEVPICGLCGNTGRVNTVQLVKTPTGIPCGVKAFCICPNGRQLKKMSLKN